MTDKPRVLIVDDAPETIQVLIVTLKDTFTVLASNNGEKALEMAAAEPRPDIILLDIMMPGMNGLEVCKQLKGNERTSHIPVLFLTAQGDELDEKIGLDCGALDYITKPFSPELVKARIRNHLALRKYQDHLEELVEERTREIVSTQDAMITGLATLVEYRDPETSGHIKRTQNYVRILAEYLKGHPDFEEILTDRNIGLICKSAAMHDIGKVAIPDNILFKPGELTRKEFAVMKKHTIFGREAIINMERGMEHSDMSFLRFALEIAFTHHEKWDGTGYHGLKRHDIPVSGRLMALADVYDALISKRIYKEPMSHRKAVEVIKKGDGRTNPNHFDPEVLEAFVENRDTFLGIAVELADSYEERKILQS